VRVKKATSVGSMEKRIVLMERDRRAWLWLTCIVVMHRDGFVHAGVGVVPLGEEGCRWSGTASWTW